MRIWIAVVLLFAVAGCGAPGGPAPVGPAPNQSTPGGSAPAGSTPAGSAPAGSAPAGSGGQAHPYPLTITRTGGFAGVDESITVRSDGGWSYGGTRAKPVAQGTLTATELDQVTRTISNPAFSTDVSPHRTQVVCNDGFTYSVTIGPETFSFEDCGTVDRPLFDALLAALHQHTPF